MPVIEITCDSDLDTLVETHDFVIVDFYITVCKPCIEFAPKFEELSNKYTNVAFCKVNAFSPNCRDIASEYNISRFPTFIILEKSRELLHEPMIGSSMVEFKLDSLMQVVLEDTDF